MTDINMTYDRLSDIVYGFRGEARQNYSEEPFEGILVLRDINTHEVIGFMILDYSKQKKLGFTNNIPHFPDVSIPF